MKKNLIPSFQTVTGELPKPGITKRGVVIIITVWCVYSILAAIPLIGTYHVPFTRALYWQVCQSSVLFVLSIPVWFIVIRWMHPVRWYWKGLAHLFLGPAYAVLNYGYLYYTILTFGGKEAAESLKNASGWLLYFNFMIYLLQFTLYHSYEILRQLRIKEKIALELSSLKKAQELATLKAQINPHFLFNTLNSISAMASTDAEETRTMIAQLADLLRYAIEGSKKDFVFLKEEIQFAKDYIALESKRMGERLSAKFQVDESLVSYQVPPMILQPLIENAIKHGIAPSEEGGSLCVQIQRESKEIIFRISDTGVGLACSDPLSTSDGVGLKNTDARLRKIYGDSASLRIQQFADAGCEVTFTLPLP